MRKAKAWMRGGRGQNTAEYMMMLAVIVGVVLIGGAIFKSRIGPIVGTVMNAISSAVGSGATGS